MPHTQGTTFPKLTKIVPMPTLKIHKKTCTRLSNGNTTEYTRVFLILASFPTQPIVRIVETDKDQFKTCCWSL